MNRWAVKYSPQLEAAFHRRTRHIWTSWRMDETSMKVKGHWRDLYRAGDKTGAQTIDFLLTQARDEEAAKRFLTKAIRHHGVPEKSTIDGSAPMKRRSRAPTWTRHSDHHPYTQILK